jgi:molecular chaperone GrpE
MECQIMSDEPKKIRVRSGDDDRTAKMAPESAADEEQAEGAVGIDAAVLQEFERELADARRQADESHDKYLRTLAELENVRKRLEKNYQNRVVEAQRNLLRGFLEVADNLERALEAAQEGGDIAGGVELTYRQLQRLLAQYGVEPIDAIGKPFDPMKHEAVGTVPANGMEDETVIAEERRGYVHDDELLRAARVYVAKQR